MNTTPLNTCGPALFALAASLTAIHAQDVEMFYAAKYQVYKQTSPLIVHLIDSYEREPMGFDCMVEETPGGTVTSATVTPPGGSPIALTEKGDGIWDYQFACEQLPDLDAAFPNGSYQFSIQTGGSPIVTSLNLNGNAYSNIPRVTNFNAAQTVNPAASFNVTWNTFTGGTSDDFIELSIYDGSGSEVYHSGPPGSGLNGTSTNHTIPANSLVAGTNYDARLSFYKIVAAGDYSGATGVVAYGRTTAFRLKTTGSPTESEFPWIENTSPWNGESGVGVDSVVAIQFSEPMTQIVKITWSGAGINPASFSYSWNHDSTHLYAVYTEPGGFPQGATVTWEVNPASGGPSMQDLAGNFLPNQQLSFVTANSASSGDNDAQEIYLVKIQQYGQTGAVPQDSQWYGLEAGAEANVMNGVLGGTVTAPGGGTVRLTSQWISDNPEIEARYTTKAELDQFFPNGSYTVNLTTAHDGPQSIGLTLPADNYPNIPTVSNIGAMAAVDPDQPLNIQWSAFSGADNSGDYIVGLYISTDTNYDVYESPYAGLGGTTTSVNIPAGTFEPGRTYTAELEFARIVDRDDTSYPGTVVLAAFSRITTFTIQTTGTPIQPTAAASLSPGFATIDVTGGRFIQYRLETSQDLTNWFQIQYPQFAFEDGQCSFSDPDLGYFKNRYYRAVEIPESEWQGPPVAIQGLVRTSGSFIPIAGATVGTSLDGNTTTTDSNGNFFLHTSTVRDPNQNYTITVSKEGYQTANLPGMWGDQPRDQVIDLHSN